MGISKFNEFENHERERKVLFKSTASPNKYMITSSHKHLTMAWWTNTMLMVWITSLMVPVNQTTHCAHSYVTSDMSELLYPILYHSHWHKMPKNINIIKLLMVQWIICFQGSHFTHNNAQILLGRVLSFKISFIFRTFYCPKARNQNLLLTYKNAGAHNQNSTNSLVRHNLWCVITVIPTLCPRQ